MHNMKYEKVKDHKNLVRDKSTNAIVNKNMNDYNTYIRMKNAKENEMKKIHYIEKDIVDIKSDIDEIKSLLKRLINES